MLPFMKPEKQSSVVVGHKKPSGGIEIDGNEGEPSHAAQAIAEDLIRAVNSKDVKAVAACLEHCFSVMGDQDDDADSGMTQQDMFGADE